MFREITQYMVSFARWYARLTALPIAVEHTNLEAQRQVTAHVVETEHLLHGTEIGEYILLVDVLGVGRGVVSAIPIDHLVSKGARGDSRQTGGSTDILGKVDALEEKR